MFHKLVGQCPELLRGSNIGVFIGASGSESHEAWSKDPETVSGYTMTGCYMSMFANRLSYFFDFKGQLHMKRLFIIYFKPLYNNRTFQMRS